MRTFRIPTLPRRMFNGNMWALATELTTQQLGDGGIWGNLAPLSMKWFLHLYPPPPAPPQKNTDNGWLENPPWINELMHSLSGDFPACHSFVGFGECIDIWNLGKPGRHANFTHVFFYWGTGGSSINKFQYTVLDFKLKDRKGNSLTMLQKNPFCFSKCSVWQDVTQLFYTSLRFVAILAGWAQENQCLHSLTEWHVTNGFLIREFLGVHFQSQGLWQWSSLCCKGTFNFHLQVFHF